MKNQNNKFIDSCLALFNEVFYGRDASEVYLLGIPSGIFSFFKVVMWYISPFFKTDTDAIGPKPKIQTRNLSR